MDITSLKARVDSLTHIRKEYSAPGSSSSRTTSQPHARHSILRSVPVDPRYSFDLSQEIQRTWSTELTCFPDLHAARPPKPAPPPPSNYRKSLSKHLQQPDALYQSLISKPINPQTTSPLFSKLPPEVREQIWSHLLTHHGVILCITSGGLPTPSYNLHPALLATSRRLCLEAAPLLYGRNRFSVFHIPNLLRSRSAPPRFALSPRYFPFVRHLNVDVPDKFIERWYYTAWGDEFESYTAVVAALVRLAGKALRHLQLSLVRNCALESYTSWGPYVAADSPLMRAVAEDFLPRMECGAGGGRRFLLLVPCGPGSAGGAEAQRAFDVLRPDAPTVVHAVARNLGRLQKTARMNGVELEESLYVLVKGEVSDGSGGLSEEARVEILVDVEHGSGEAEGKGIALEVAY
ncbi:uncharacterized protein LTHEOB_7308 [Neofusicoccum parvum]|uniref:Uncharacterized protein LTHEOB_7308 n=1 Tax=Neofusicoccum parvum TaxID=310453 RepID=A0ACB5RZV7_9PEZI|nr:uncharacterized protein LTHEOB_7308 [Neofusicoccum parvum]